MLTLRVAGTQGWQLSHPIGWQLCFVWVWVWFWVFEKNNIGLTEYDQLALEHGDDVHMYAMCDCMCWLLLKVG